MSEAPIFHSPTDPELQKCVVRTADDAWRRLQDERNRAFMCYGPGEEWDRMKASEQMAKKMAHRDGLAIFAYRNRAFLPADAVWPAWVKELETV